MSQNAVNDKDVVAFLGKGTSFKGVITYEGSIRIDGQVEGEIVSKGSLIVGDSAEIKAEVTVANIVCGGKIVGNIHASGKTHLLSTAKVNGSIRTPALIIDEGVAFNGQCDMKKDGKGKGSS